MNSPRLVTRTRTARHLWNPSHYVSKIHTRRQQQNLLDQRTHTRYGLQLSKSGSSTPSCTYSNQASTGVASPIIPMIQAKPIAVNRAQYTTQATAWKEPVVHSTFEEHTGTWQYVVADPYTKRAVIIDPVLDYDASTQTMDTQTADALLAMISEGGYNIEKILETHAHADHLTAASYLQQRLSSQQGFRPPICIGKRIREVQIRFAPRYGITAVEYESAFDHLFEDDEVFKIGQLKAEVMHLPGHTPDHIGYRIGDNVFCGDSIFHADIGTARCDFPGGSAKSLYASARKLLELPEDVKIWTGHDYPACPQRCEAVPWMTVRDHKDKNKHLGDGVKESDFLTLRKERDASLAAPKLLHPSLQTNIRAGRLPQPTPGDQRLMRLPIKMKSGTL